MSVKTHSLPHLVSFRFAHTQVAQKSHLVFFLFFHPQNVFHNSKKAACGGGLPLMI